MCCYHLPTYHYSQVPYPGPSFGTIFESAVEQSSGGKVDYPATRLKTQILSSTFAPVCLAFFVSLNPTSLLFLIISVWD